MQNNNTTNVPPHDEKGIVRFGLSVLFIVFVIIGGWMATAPLATSVVAAGKVTAGTDKKTVQHLESGIAESIYVENGDFVTQGQTLLILNSIQTKSQLDIFEAQYQDAIATLARLEAQKNNASSIVFPKNLHDKNIIKNQKNIFNTTKKTIEDEKKITQNRIVQFENQILGQNSVIKSKEKRLFSISQELQEQEELFTQQLVSKEKIRDLKNEKDRIDGDIASTESTIAKLKEQISEAQNQQLLREKQFRKDTLEKYGKMKSSASDLKSKIIAAQDSIRRSKIIAPISGTIIGLDMHTEGGVIAAGKPILEIIPANSKLIIEVEMQTTDVDKVKIGLHSDIRFSAFEAKLIDIVDGKVSYVSADSFVNKQSGMPFYKVKVQITDLGMKELQKSNLTLVAGMPAQVMITTGSRTVLDYLIKPFKDMLVRSFNEE